VLFELLTGDVPFSGETPVEIAMKHLSEAPDPPSAKRNEVPTDLDLVVLRALAKEPPDRYQSAAAMDADLETVAHGGHVPVETADAATIVLSGGRGADAPTAVTQLRRGRAVPPGFPPGYEPPKPRRGMLWPWLLGFGALLAILVGGWFLVDTIRDQLEASKPVSVPYVVALREANARNEITDSGLKVRVNHVPSSDVEEGFVISQTPTQGTRVEKETIVVIDVSTGKREVTVPSVVGQDDADAIEELTRAGLDAHVVNVSSDKDVGVVTGQQPAPGVVVVEGTQVRINVSSGPKQVTVPSVLLLPYEQAVSELQRGGFKVSRIDVDSDQANGLVVNQDPNGGATASQGSTVTLSVSKGPVTSAIPDVTTQEYSVAQATLEGAGFRTKIVFEDTEDPSLDGIVVSQDPVGGSQDKPNTVVTLFVGRLVQPTDTTETTPTP
jgi:beta-lactam-binding protein with PASTA domain